MLVRVLLFFLIVLMLSCFNKEQTPSKIKSAIDIEEDAVAHTMPIQNRDTKRFAQGEINDWYIQDLIETKFYESNYDTNSK